MCSFVFCVLEEVGLEVKDSHSNLRGTRAPPCSSHALRGGYNGGGGEGSTSAIYVARTECTMIAAPAVG